jgi:hypothetical protein
LGDEGVGERSGDGDGVDGDGNCRGVRRRGRGRDGDAAEWRVRAFGEPDGDAASITTAFVLHLPIVRMRRSRPTHSITIRSARVERLYQQHRPPSGISAAPFSLTTTCSCSSLLPSTPFTISRAPPTSCLASLPSLPEASASCRSPAHRCSSTSSSSLLCSTTEKASSASAPSTFRFPVRDAAAARSFESPSRSKISNDPTESSPSSLCFSYPSSASPLKPARPSTATTSTIRSINFRTTHLRAG